MSWVAFLKRLTRSEKPRKRLPASLGRCRRRLCCEPLENRRLLSVVLNWPGAGSALSLTEGASGATPAITISEPSPNVSQLKIDLGPGQVFAGTSTGSATGLAYQNAGSPATSEYATVNMSPTNNISALAATLPGDGLTLGPINDLQGGPGSITVSAATIAVAGINTMTANGNVVLSASGNLAVAAGAVIETGTGTISLAAGVNGGAATLSIGGGAMVVSTSPAANAIALSGSAVNVAATADVGAQRPLNTTPAATLTGLSLSGLITPLAMACDGGGNLFVPNPGNSTVSEFAPGGTTPSTTLSTGLNKPTAVAFSPSGNLYVANAGGSTVSEFAPATTTPLATLTGVSAPDALAFDSSGNLYAATWSASVSMFTPTKTTPSVTEGMGSDGQTSCYGAAVAMAPTGHLYAVDNDRGAGLNSWVTVYSNPMSGGYSDFGDRNAFGDMWDPAALVFDSSGNFYVADDSSLWKSNGCVFKFASGATSPAATLAGLDDPTALAVDANGDLYVANYANNTVSEFAPGATTPTATLTGLSGPSALAFDGDGDLFVANKGNNTASEFTPASPAPAVTGISPASGAAAGGTAVTITGTNLAGATAVKFGTAAATITSETANQIVATSPAGVTGTVDVTVTTASGVSPTSSANRFNYPAPLVVTPANWTSAGMTLTLGSDGNLHFYATGTTTDAIGPQPPAMVTNINVTSPSGTTARLTIDSTAGSPLPAGGLSLGGAAGLTKTGPGTVVLSGANTYTGPTTVVAGTLLVRNPAALPDGGGLVVGAGGTFIFDPLGSG